LLGAAIGTKVLEDVSFIVGLDRFLGNGLNLETHDYLHEMGAACATTGAVGLFHVENITPEAVDFGRDLLVLNHKTFSINERQLQNLLVSYPLMWTDKWADPDKCIIGCPHLSLEQLIWWIENIHSGLHEMGRKQLPVKTTLCAAPQVLRELKSDANVRAKLESTVIKLSAGCPMQLFDNNISAGEAIVTNSNKLRAYTTARFFPDEELVKIIVSGRIRSEQK